MDGDKIEKKLFDFPRALSRRQNELIGEFMMAACYVISIGGVVYEVHVHSNKTWKEVGGISERVSKIRTIFSENTA